MNKNKIDLKTYKRIEHFDYFSKIAYPYVGLTVNVDITNLYNYVKDNKLPFFLTMLTLTARAANKIKEFRQIIIGGEIYEYDCCRTSHTVSLEDETYCYCELEHNLSLKEYLPYAIRTQEFAKTIKRVKDDENLIDELIFFSSVPWITYKSVVNPVPYPADSNPRITFGKYYNQEDKIIMPVSVLVNHALVDGFHLAKFYQNLEELIKTIEKI